MGTQTVTEMTTVVSPGPRLDRLIRLAEAVDVLLQLSWTELRQKRKVPVGVDDNTAVDREPEAYQEYKAVQFSRSLLAMRGMLRPDVDHALQP